MKRLAFGLVALLSITACGGGGGGSAPPPANTNPVANAGADQTVDENTLVTLDGSGSSDTDGSVASFAWTRTAGPVVTLTGGNLAMPTFTAPDVTGATTLTFQLTVTDDDGATNTDSVDITVNDVVNQNPIANAGADQAVAEGAAATLDGSASSDPDGSIAIFAWTQTVGPTAVLAGAATAMPTFTAPTVTGNTTLTFQLTVTDNLGATNTDTVDITVTDATPNVTISGKVTYDHVKHDPFTNGLDFNSTTQDPVRGATVQALDAGNAVLVSTRTDDAGDYSLAVAPSTQVRIRVRAEITQTGLPSFDVRIVDNTSGGAVYALDGSPADSGTAPSTRNLNAASGWDTGAMAYTTTRAAAPFAILDSIFAAVTQTAAVDATVVLPPLLANWSVDNVPSDCPGGNAVGCISTTNYDSIAIYILGAANNDSDEFDGHIVVHEWGHYFEEKLSRADSVGGPHSGGDVLDTRVAFGEGFGNGLSAIITGDPSYRDSSGTNEAQGFEINNETNNDEGWFSESTVQSLLYDLADATPDGAADTLALGWGPLYDTFVSDAYTNNAAQTTIFSYLARLRADNAGSAAAITALAAASNVNGSDEFGAGETFLPPGTTNVGDITLYTDIAPNNTAVEVCSINEFGTFNRLSNRRFLRLPISASATYRIQASAPGNADPDVILYKEATAVGQGFDVGNENFTQALTPGTHIIEAYDFCNVGPGQGGCPGSGNARTCIDVTVTQL